MEQFCYKKQHIRIVSLGNSKNLIPSGNAYIPFESTS